MRHAAVIRRRLWMGLVLVALGAAPALASSYPGPAPVVQEIQPRLLPSVVVEWRWTGPVDQWRLDDGVVYLVGGGLLSALDAGSGEELWAYELAQECSCSKIAVLPSRIVAGIDGRAILVDRASGALVADVPLGESVSSIVTEPLVIGFRGALDREALVRLDPISGVELARYTAPGDLRDVEELDEVIVVKLGTADGSSQLVGLGDSLHPVWRRTLPEDSYLERQGDELIVESWEPNRTTRFAVVPESGELRPLPESEAEVYRFDLRVSTLDNGLLQVVRTGEPPRLVRPDGVGGEPAWETEMPLVVSDVAEWEARFVLLSSRWGGRGILLMVDREDGAILRQVAGLRQMSELEVHGDLLLSETASGLAAVRLDRFGPSEAASMSVAESVAEILEGLAGEEPALEPYAVRQDLEALGEAALPYLVEALPNVSDDVAQLIAQFVAQHRYTPGAAALAARVVAALSMPADDTQSTTRRSPYLRVLAFALAATAGPDQVPVLERLLEPGTGLDSGHLPALAALGRLAPSSALAIVGRLRDRFAPDGGWFEAPKAGPRVEIAALEPPSGDFATLAMELSSEELQRLMLRRTTALAASPDESWVVFHDSSYGPLDLWAAPVDGAGQAGGALYLGPLPLPADEEEANELGAIDARLVGGALDVGFPGGDRLVVEVAELREDGDGDGLADRFETHLGLDPGQVDSDGDGIADGVDRAPSGGKSDPSREERAFLALHETLALLAAAELEGYVRPEGDHFDPWPVPVHYFLGEGPALEWRAGEKATFRRSGSPRYDCRVGGYRLSDQPPRALENDEIAVEQFQLCPLDYGDDSGAVYVLRETDGAWVVSGFGG